MSCCRSMLNCGRASQSMAKKRNWLQQAAASLHNGGQGLGECLWSWPTGQEAAAKLLPLSTMGCS